MWGKVDVKVDKPHFQVASNRFSHNLAMIEAITPFTPYPYRGGFISQR